MKRLTLTGIDERTDPQWVRDVLRDTHGTGLTGVRTNHSALEFGILRGPKAGTHPRFPHRKAVEALLCAGAPGDFAFHLCGEYAQMVSRGDWHQLLDIIDFTQVGRVQVNLSSTTGEYLDKRILTLWRFSKFIDRPVIMQWRDDTFPLVPNGLHLLADRSGGNGKLPEAWPTRDELCSNHSTTRLGFAGGLGPYNVTRQLNLITKANGGTGFWVDCESSLRTNDWFDINKAHEMIKAVRSALPDLFVQPKEPEVGECIPAT